MSDRIESMLPAAHIPPVVLTHEGLAKSVLRASGQPDRLLTAGQGLVEWTAMTEAVSQSLPLLDRLRPLSEDPGCIEDLLGLTSAVKQALVGLGLLGERLQREVGILAEVAIVAANYQGALARMGARDSRDLVGDAVGLLQTQSDLLVDWADWLVVDEAEDLSPAQWHLILQLGRRLTPPRRLVLAGDVRVALPALNGPTSRFFEEAFALAMRPKEWTLQVDGATWVENVGAALGLPPLRLLPGAVRISGLGHGGSASATGWIWSAPDETDEAFAVAREIKRAQLAGEVSLDEVAVLLWDPSTQLGHLSEALRAIGVAFQSERHRWQNGFVVRVISAWFGALLDPGSDASVLPILVEGPGAAHPDDIWRFRQEAAQKGQSLSDSLLQIGAAKNHETLPKEILRVALLWGTLLSWVGPNPSVGMSTADFAKLMAEIEMGSGLCELALADSEAADEMAHVGMASAAAADTIERMGPPTVALSRWASLLKIGLRRSTWTDSGIAPGDTPKVSVLSVFASKGRHWRRAFLPGSVEGRVPSAGSRLGPLTFQETERLVELVPEMEDVMTALGDPRERARRLVFTGLTRGTEQTTVSWSRRVGERECKPSFLLAQLAAAGFVEVPAPRAFPVTRQDCVALAASSLTGPSPREVLAASPPFRERVETLAGCLAPWDPMVGSEALPGSDLSATSVRAWLACPRLHYYGLLRPRQRDSAPLVLGIAAHRLLELAHQRRLASSRDSDSFISAAQLIVTQELMPEVRFRLVDPLLSLFVEIWLRQMIVRWATLVVGSEDRGRQLASEVRFQVERGPLRLTGKVDALWRHEDGSLEVVDYKTATSDLPSVPGLTRQLFGTEEEGPSDWQLPIYLMAARSGAFEDLIEGDRPSLARNWYVGAEPGRKRSLVTKGFRLVGTAPAASGGLADLSWEQLDRLETDLQRQAELIIEGRFPAAPRHGEHTCRDHRGCPLEACCDGEGTVGPTVLLPRSRP